MSHTAHKNMVTLSLLLGMLFLAISTQPSTACPETCFCMDAFVTCTDFKYLDLTLLPPDTDTLVLTKGEVEEIPPGFLATAVNLKMLEIISVHVRVVRGSAFRGLRNMDLFSIIGSSFDIVEPDGFSGLSEVSKFHISDSSFGRVGKHAFGYINNINDLRIWSNNFETISDEAFYKLSDVASLQFYHNNITYMGNDVFTGAFRLEEVSINLNRIQTMLEGNFENIARATSRMVLQANTFRCSCEIAWILNKPILNVYLPLNHCLFKGNTAFGIGTFRMNDTSKDILCSKFSPMKSVASTPENDVDAATVGSLVDFNYVEEIFDPVVDEHEGLTDELMISTLSSNLSSNPLAMITVSSASLISSDVSSSVSLSSSSSSASSVYSSLPSSLASFSSSTFFSSSLPSSSPSSVSLSSTLLSTKSSSSLSPEIQQKQLSSDPISSSIFSTSSVPNTSTLLSSSPPTLSLLSILQSTLSSSSASSSSPSISSSPVLSSSATSSSPSSLSSSSSSLLPPSSSLPSSESHQVYDSHDLPPTVTNNEPYSTNTLNSSKILTISTSSSSSSSSLSSSSSSLPSSESHQVFHNHDIPPTVTNNEHYSTNTLNSSSSSSSVEQTTSQLPSEQPLNHSDISTSAISSSSLASFPDTTTPAAHTHYDSKFDSAPAHDSHINTLIEETTRETQINEISTRYSSDTPDLAPDGDIIKENESPAQLSVSKKKHELGVPYSTAAFEVANLFQENSSHTSSSSWYLIASLSAFCFLLISHKYIQIAG